MIVQRNSEYMTHFDLVAVPCSEQQRVLSDTEALTRVKTNKTNKGFLIKEFLNHGAGCTVFRTPLCEV